jgi:DNA polymerase-3 subunit alpha
MFIGKIEEIKTKISKKGNRFSILTLLDLHGNLEFTIFEKTMEKLEALGANELLAIYAEVFKDSSGTSFRVLKVMDLQEAKKQKTEIIKIDNEKQNEIIIGEIANHDNQTNIKNEIDAELNSNDLYMTIIKNDKETQTVFEETERIFTGLLDTVSIEDNIKTLEIMVEISNDTVILDKISQLSHAHKGSQKAKLTITYKEQKLKEIPFSFGVNDGFISEIKKIEGVRLQK